MSTVKTVVLGAAQQHFVSNGDQHGRCPRCYNSNTVQKTGVLTINGTPQDVYKCTQCNTLHSGPDGGIRSLIEEAKTVYDAESVGYTSVNISDAINYINDNSSNNSEMSGSLASLNTNISNLSNNVNNMNSNYWQMQNAMENLARTVEKLAQQNTELAQKLMTDPLNGIRKAVSEFNLE